MDKRTNENMHTAKYTNKLTLKHTVTHKQTHKETLKILATWLVWDCAARVFIFFISIGNHVIVKWTLDIRPHT